MIIERGDYFRPTIGTAITDGFTVGHPRSRPWCSERNSFLLLNDNQEQKLLSSSHKVLETSFIYTKKWGMHEYFQSHSSTSFIIL
jgi:hypothetical protein